MVDQDHKEAARAAGFELPKLTDLGALGFGGLNRQSQQHQQWQSQGEQQQRNWRRLNRETGLPEEDSRASLRLEIRQLNRLIPTQD